MENKIKTTLFKVTEPSSVPYRTPACAKRAAYSDPPSVIPVPESIAAQAAYQLRYENTEYYSWVGSGPKCFQVLGLSPSLLQNPGHGGGKEATWPHPLPTLTRYAGCTKTASWMMRK